MADSSIGDLFNLAKIQRAKRNERLELPQTFVRNTPASHKGQRFENKRMQMSQALISDPVQSSEVQCPQQDEGLEMAQPSVGQLIAEPHIERPKRNERREASQPIIRDQFAK